jgi:hypothetical protein
MNHDALIASLALSLLMTLALEIGFFILVSKLLAGKSILASENFLHRFGADDRGRSSLRRLIYANVFTREHKCVKKDLLLVALVNVLTNPVVVLLYWLAVTFLKWNKLVIILPLELSAVLAEGYYYSKYGCGFRRPYLFSAAANAFSFGAGVLIQLFA